MPSSGVKKCALDRKSTRLNSSHTIISYAVFCLKKTKRACRARRAHLRELTSDHVYCHGVPPIFASYPLITLIVASLLGHERVTARIFLRIGGPPRCVALAYADKILI